MLAFPWLLLARISAIRFKVLSLNSLPRQRKAIQFSTASGFSGGCRTKIDDFIVFTKIFNKYLLYVEKPRSFYDRIVVGTGRRFLLARSRDRGAKSMRNDELPAGEHKAGSVARVSGATRQGRFFLARRAIKPTRSNSKHRRSRWALTQHADKSVGPARCGGRFSERTRIT